MISLLQQTAIPAATEAHQPSADVAGTTSVVTTTTDGAATAADHVTAAAAGGHEAVASVGMPQLDITTFANQIFWLALTLLLIWWVLSRVALPRIGGVLADRQNAIGGDLGAAEEFKRKARDAEAAYERALAEARGEAQGIVAQQKAAIQAEVDAAIAHADAEISARGAESEGRISQIKASSLDDARSVAREVTAELVNAFGGRADADAVSAAVDHRLQGVAR
ncbi:F0F1 ATP synthase subunit B' [Paracoccus suum]|uniref:ATP synthase subunit b n=1 Tax=Paracoccus suum TaxID=2259340 RepID=A0A344PKI0_9RHOB|nr:F0F1 ATP synthase subunit B' [Paracoccus suum]AXC49885.1 F0F1 ATP synthase subunit B' [Paracoccus suum]